MLSSERPEIITNIRSAIAEDVKADVVKVNLGKGRSWWSTRLHLLSALCADYTEVRQIVFEAEGYRFLGMCTPCQARRVLARAFPDVENAYRRSVPSPQQTSFNPVEEVSLIVDHFSNGMDALGGEPNVKKWVEPHLIENWPGISKDCVDVSGGAVTPSLLESIVRRQTPFVVLVRDDIVQKIVEPAPPSQRGWRSEHYSSHAYDHSTSALRSRSKNVSAVSDALTVNLCRLAQCCEARPIQPFEVSRFCSRRTLWDLNRVWFGSCYKEEYLRGDRRVEDHTLTRRAKGSQQRVIVRETDQSSRLYSRISYAACFGHEKASGAKRLRSNGLVVAVN